MENNLRRFFKEANYFAYERLDLELDAREMKFFLSEQYISKPIALSGEELYSLRIAKTGRCMQSKLENRIQGV